MGLIFLKFGHLQLTAFLERLGGLGDPSDPIGHVQINAAPSVTVMIEWCSDEEVRHPEQR